MFKKKLFLSGCILVCLIVYILVINVVYNVMQINPGNVFFNSSDSTTNSNNIKVAVSDSISVSVEKHRFYGTIISEGTNSHMYLLNFIKVPLGKDDFNFIYLHCTVLIILIALLVLIIIVPMKGGLKENEKLA